MFDDEFAEEKECCCAADTVDFHRDDVESAHSRSVLIGSVITLVAVGLAAGVVYFVVRKK